MANPSNKKSGKSYLKTFTKEDLIDRGINQAENIVELQNEIQALKSQNASLMKENETLQRKLNRAHTKEDVVKKILDLRAKNYSPVIIRDKLALMGIDKDAKEIKNIITEELSPSLELYFNERKREYAESIKINTTYYSQSSIDEIQRLIDSAYEDLEKCEEEDIIQRSKLRDSISNYLAKRDTLMRNVAEIKDERNEEDEEALERVKQWEQDSKDAMINIFEMMRDQGANDKIN